jgi:hypothetical protein
MEKKTKSGPKIAELVGKTVTLLEPLESDERQKVIKAVLTILGEASTSSTGNGGGGAHNSGEAGQRLSVTSPRSKTWMQQNGLTAEQIEQVFDLATGEVIASEVPGKSDKEKTYNAYVLLGIGRLLASGDASFDDKSARKLCESLGCFIRANHARYMAEKPNVLVGTKEKGWKVTAPGLGRGADVVKELTTGK